MADSSSSLPTPTRGWMYDVFLSFRGEDTRYNFVDHLYAALVRSGLTVFKDDEMLHRGKQISPELLKAIEESTHAVVVFSKNYANSSWCLGELAKIMECHNQKQQLVIPVFYHVDPSDVRRQKRDFETAFRQHAEKSWEEIDEVNEWREALIAVSRISCHHIPKTAKQGESVFINKIVRDILVNIRPGGMEKNLIGIESRISELNLLLATEARQEVRMVGIWGMGGIGKTTLARALFRRISCKFDGSSFVKGVRENSKRGIPTLQEKILKDMTHHEYKIIDVEDGAEMIQTRVCKKKVLLVLDDVDDAKQLEFLAASHKWFGAGSRIVITTRDQNLLSDTNAIYKPAFFHKKHAVELFSRHAFRRNSPPEEYKELSNRAISYTGGLPLALKVLGSFLHGREAGVWNSALNRLAKTPNIEIFETLKVSFDGLEASEKKIFLDIACFFKGHDEKRVKIILDSFGFDPVIGISALIEKSLITVSRRRIEMHDVLQEMGLEIVRMSYPNSRLWKCNEIHDFITKNKNLEAVEAIVQTFIYKKGWMDSYIQEEIMGFTSDVFENMKNIRLLDIHNNFTSCKPTSLPDELQWLRWHGYPFSILPVASLCKLVGLEISYGEVEHLWKGYKLMPNLKFIELEFLGCLESVPDVSGAPNVEKLILFSCINLVEVHTSLGTLRKLVYLNMRGCSRLKCLPSMIEMQLLETVDLSYCSSLEKFPEFSSGMEKLSNIYLNGCSDLEIIPSTICELKGLKSLHLDNCMQLQKLPLELGSMEKLEELHLGMPQKSDRPGDTIMFGMPQNSDWRDSIIFPTSTNLCCLRKLDLRWGPIEDVDFLDINLDAFSSLEELYLSGNSKLVQLPASISHVSLLKHLELNDCQQLQTIQGLPSGIQVLKAINCRALEKIEDLTEEYVWLHTIFLHGCERLLDNPENETYLNKMLQHSLVKKCVAVDHVLSIDIPGSKIPNWLEEEWHGSKLALKLPPKCHHDIMGFVVSGLSQRESINFANADKIYFHFGIDEMVYPVHASRIVEKKSVWIVYIPFSFFQDQTYDDFELEDLSLFEGKLLISTIGRDEVVRCGAHIVYKEDVSSIQHIETYIPENRNSGVFQKIGNRLFRYRK